MTKVFDLRVKVILVYCEKRMRKYSKILGETSVALQSFTKYSANQSFLQREKYPIPTLHKNLQQSGVKAEYWSNAFPPCSYSNSRGNILRCPSPISMKLWLKIRYSTPIQTLKEFELLFIPLKVIGISFQLLIP